VKIFAYNFKRIDDESIEDLLSLQREQAIYTDHWIDGLDDFRHVRIAFTAEETAEYVRSMKAFELYLGSKAKWARDVPGIPSDIARRADCYSAKLRDGTVLPPPYHCLAAFLGPHLEAMVCGFDKSRSQILDEQGTAAFLSTIRRAADALTPAIRCFTSRERNLTPWSVSREDDVRDLLYAMLRASISDIKREEPIPSRAGVAKVADLHSRLAKTLIEIKWVGKRGQWKKILEEIYVDIQTYGMHPDCDCLVFVVVDYARDIADPHMVETQISGTQKINERSIRVLLYVREP
jgi:hypothetical protein